MLVAIRKPSLEALERMSDEELAMLEGFKSKIHEERLKLMASYAKRWVKKKVK
tara:strand:- start:6996 stop:7154 length:159 start_codon:yes stop_codon:yes gene_type:complete